MTEAELIAIRREVGDKPEDGDIEDVLTRLGTVDATIDEILETRLATLLASPAQFSIPGEYSQNNQANIDALQKKLSARGSGDAAAGTVDFIAAPAPRVR